jgi:hypothetical protein
MPHRLKTSHITTLEPKNELGEIATSSIIERPKLSILKRKLFL